MRGWCDHAIAKARPGLALPILPVALVLTAYWRTDMPILLATITLVVGLFLVGAFLGFLGRSHDADPLLFLALAGSWLLPVVGYVEAGSLQWVGVTAVFLPVVTAFWLASVEPPASAAGEWRPISWPYSAGFAATFNVLFYFSTQAPSVAVATIATAGLLGAAVLLHATGQQKAAGFVQAIGMLAVIGSQFVRLATSAAANLGLFDLCFMLLVFWWLIRDSLIGSRWRQSASPKPTMPA